MINDDGDPNIAKTKLYFCKHFLSALEDNKSNLSPRQSLASAVFSRPHEEVHAVPDPARVERDTMSQIPDSVGHYVPDCVKGDQ